MRLICLILLMSCLSFVACDSTGSQKTSDNQESKGLLDQVKETADNAAEGAKEAVKDAAESATDVAEAAKKEMAELLKGAPADIQFIKVGDKAPMTDTKLKDISDKDLSLEEINGENGLLVVFSCNTCPYVIGWEDRYLELAKQCKEAGVGMVAINSNEAKRGKTDSFEAMQAHAKEVGYDFSYLLDSESTLAKSFGATRTPDIFLFDKDLNLQYKGAIDDNMKDATKVEEPYLKNAIQNMVDGKPIDPNKTKSIGCTIKWKKA